MQYSVPLAHHRSRSLDPRRPVYELLEVPGLPDGHQDRVDNGPIARASLAAKLGPARGGVRGS